MSGQTQDKRPSPKVSPEPGPIASLSKNLKEIRIVAYRCHCDEVVGLLRQMIGPSCGAKDVVDYNWANLSDNLGQTTLNMLRLEGAGYFVLSAEDPNLGVTGSYFTMSGAFQVDASGNIITSDGYFLQGFAPSETEFVSSNLTNIIFEAQKPYGTINVELPQGSIEGALVSLGWPSNWDLLTQVVTADDIAKGFVTFDGYSFLYPEVAAVLSPAYSWTQVKIDAPGDFTVDQIVTVETSAGTWSKTATASDLEHGYMLMDLPLLSSDEASGLVVKVSATGAQSQISSAHVTVQDEHQATSSTFNPILGVEIVVSQDGVVSERYSNGEQQALAVLALANFGNARGLAAVGSNDFAATTVSGDPALATVGGSNAGTVSTDVIDLSGPQMSSAAAVSVAENVSTSTVVYTASATDADPNAVLTYWISGGADAALFNIDPLTGAVTFGASPDYENPADVGVNNVYDIVIQASDGTLSATQDLAITVTNVNEAPFMTSADAASTPEHVSTSAAVYTATATDPDANTTLTYSIAGGADAALFKIDASTGQVSFLASPSFKSPADADANNAYDITVRASDGALHVDQAVEITVTAVNGGPSPAKDFNADGKGDILLQNVSDGSCYVWELNGVDSLAGNGYVGWTPGKDWVAKGVGDFNGDGKSDVLLQNANDGSCYIWESNGAGGLVGNGYVGWTPGKDWVVKGVGDFNGDGKSDVLLQNANDGSCYVWELNGTNGLVGNGFVGWTPGNQWGVKGVGDFNGDGKSDVLLQNAKDGSCYIWELNGTSGLVGNGFVGWTPGADWVARGVGDFNGDGKSDVLLQNANDGSCYVWELNGTDGLAGNGFVGWTPGKDWVAKSPDDFNGDGKSDVLLQNVNNGACYVWELNGTVLVGNGYEGWTPGAGWVATA